MAILHQKLAARLFLSVFPITQHERIVTMNRDDNDKTKKISVAIADARKTQTVNGAWIILPDHHEEVDKKPPNTYFELAGCRIADDCHYDELRGQLCYANIGGGERAIARQDSRTQLSLSARNTWAALVYGSQLVNTLAVIFDFRLPRKVSVADMSLSDRWTDGLFDTDVIKLNMAILTVALCQLDQSMDEMKLKRPFANLLALSRRVLVEPNSCIENSRRPPVLSESMWRDIITECDRITWQERAPNTLPDDWVSVEEMQMMQCGDDSARVDHHRLRASRTVVDRLTGISVLLTAVISLLS